MPDTGRILVWFSCGAASAVAAKVAVTRYAAERTVEVCYCAGTEKDEHPDNARFLTDVERWIGQPVVKLYPPTFRTCEDVWRGKRWIVHHGGASCTLFLKRQVQQAYARPEDWRVVGFTADERDRLERLEERYPDEKFLWVLADAGITKEDCYHVLSSAGIELPAMYRLGYGHNNCIGCVKGGKGYWNKIRRDFPELFARRAAIQRLIGVPFRAAGAYFYLDELDPAAGRDVPEPPIECGVFCGHYSTLVDLAVSASLSPTEGGPHA